MTTGLPALRAARVICFCRPGTFSTRHLDAEIAARHHDSVGEVDDRLEVIESRRLLDLGHDRRAAARELAGLGDVLGPLHEGERDPSNA